MSRPPSRNMRRQPGMHIKPAFNEVEIERHADGRLTVRTDHGPAFPLTPDRVKTLADMTFQRERVIAGASSRMLHFINGGVPLFAYGSAGRLIDLSANNLQGALSPDNEIVFFLLPEPRRHA